MIDFRRKETLSKPSDTPSPAARNTILPLQPPASHQPQPQPPSQLGYQSFPTRSIRQSQHSGSNSTPRSPLFSRAVPNGTGPRPQGGQSAGTFLFSMSNDTDAVHPVTGLSIPRLGPHAHNAQTSGLPLAAQMSVQHSLCRLRTTLVLRSSYAVYIGYTNLNNHRRSDIPVVQTLQSDNEPHLIAFWSVNYAV